MTSLPADILGLTDRGRIQVGLAADLLPFDPGRVRATATCAEPLSLAEGFDLVLVNGRVARRDDVFDGVMSRQVLRPAP
jgi:N-acyl-D-amino-acid deacylase